jgi:carbohydrate-selective porin OprB
MRSHYKTLFIFVALACQLKSGVSLAGDGAQENWNAHAQSTYIWQNKSAFSAPYTSDFSLRPERERSYSLSLTAALGWRIAKETELYFNPEASQGLPFSNLTGLGGMSNGELQKVSGTDLKFYRARLFIRQNWNLGGEKVAVASDFNQLAGLQDKRRITLTIGNLAVTDIFDGSAIAHDARTQFINWSLLTHGAFDFAADARGYSLGAALEYYADDWVVRGGRFMQPAESNGLPLDTRIMRHYGDQLELEHAHSIAGLAGKVRILAFRNQALMGSFRDALADAPANGGVPDVSRVRTERSKIGAGLNVEQAITPEIGVFARASWNDGASETYAFTEIERSLSIGAAISGSLWQREQDTIGMALVRNGLSQAHRDYLAQGGHGAFIGDGRLNYRPEDIAEIYYRLGVTPALHLTLDLQHIRNPAYNADRGPVSIASMRLHAQY